MLPITDLKRYNVPCTWQLFSSGSLLSSAPNFQMLWWLKFRFAVPGFTWPVFDRKSRQLKPTVISFQWLPNISNRDSLWQCNFKAGTAGKVVYSTYRIDTHSQFVNLSALCSDFTYTTCHTLAVTESTKGSRWRSAGRQKSRGQQVFCVVLPARFC